MGGQNLADASVVAQQVRSLARRVSEDVGTDGRPAVRVWLKVRYAPFETHTYSRALAEPTADPAVLETTAVELLDRLDPARAVRLLGVRRRWRPALVRIASRRRPAASCGPRRPDSAPPRGG